MYKLLRTLLFLFPTEEVHYFSMNILKGLCRWNWCKNLVSWACRPEGQGRAASYKLQATSDESGGMNGDQRAASDKGSGMDRSLEREVFGLTFRNPVGLGAGFDKNALFLRELDALGFGFVEVGTVTPLPQDGNEKPRLFRLPQDQALINRMGFNNEGVKAIAQRLKQWREENSRVSAISERKSGTVSDRASLPLLIGGNIGKNKVTPNEEAWKDYIICFKELFPYVDYFVVNVSSPNTPGLRALQEKDALHNILTRLQALNLELSVQEGIRPRPLLLKIAPDLSWQQVDDVVDLAMDIRLDGLVATNTTISREGLISSQAKLEAIGAGGLSGAPLKERSSEIIRYIRDKTNRTLPIIASGGIFTPEDGAEKLAAGGSLIQVWTGFIYEGPFIVARLCRKI